MTTTVLGTADVISPVPAGPTAPLDAAGVALDDDTVLIAWQSETVVTVRHYTRDLGTVLGEATAAGGGVRGLLVVTTPDGAEVITSTQAFTVTLDPLTVTPGPTYPQVRLGYLNNHATVGDATVIAADGVVAVHRPGQALTTYPTPAQTAVAAYPTGDGAAYIVASEDGVVYDHVPSVYRFDLAGGFTLHQPGPEVPTVYGGMAVPSWGWVSVHPDGQTTDLRDATGGVLTSRPWPARPGGYLAGPVGSAAHPDGGALLAILHSYDGGSGIGLAYADESTLELTDLPLTDPAHVRAATSSEGPSVSTNGRTGVVVLAAGQNPGGDISLDTRLVVAWTVDLGATFDGILHVDTIDAPHWLVGTRDPGMDYRLHVGDLVEILAGQEGQATHRLRVCDGQEWPVAAYLRPV